jgi:hypothetical protein
LTSSTELPAQQLPGSRIVKAFNTTTAPVLAEGQVNGVALDVFLASDDDAAKSLVSQLVKAAGMRPVDAGRLDNARLLERLTAVPGRAEPALRARLPAHLQTAPRRTDDLGAICLLRLREFEHRVVVVHVVRANGSSAWACNSSASACSPTQVANGSVGADLSASGLLHGQRG